MDLHRIDEEAAERLTQLENWEVARGLDRPAARARVARAVGVSEGSLDRVRRKRLKGVRAYVLAAIRAAFVRALEFEVQRLSHELELVLSGGDGVAPELVDQAFAALKTAQAIAKERA